MTADDPIENVCQEKVYESIFRSHATDLHNFLHYKYGSGNNPKDIVQEAFLKLWKNCKSILPEKAKSFLFTVANNQMLNELSKSKTALRFTETKPKNYTIESPEYLLQEDEYKSRLEAALADLSEDQRVTFLLNRVEGKKHKEIAEMLDISRKTVEKRIYTTIKILKTKLGDF